jgi:hypothetical protein
MASSTRYSVWCAGAWEERLQMSLTLGAYFMRTETELVLKSRRATASDEPPPERT